MPKKNLNLNVRKLILALIVIDLIIAGIVLIRPASFLLRIIRPVFPPAGRFRHQTPLFPHP